MRPALVRFWDHYWRHAGQLLANFSPVPSTGNIPRSVSFLNWQMSVELNLCVGLTHIDR